MKTLILFLIFVFISVSCTPSEEEIQETVQAIIRETQTARPRARFIPASPTKPSIATPEMDTNTPFSFSFPTVGPASGVIEPTETRISTPDPSALQLQAVLTAVATQLSRCREPSYPHGPPVVITEKRPKGPSASFTCSMSADTSYFVSISSSDRKAVPANQVMTEQASSGEKCFHGYILYEEIAISPQKRFIRLQSQEWQAQNWLVSVKASYDYGYYHYTAQEFSEAVYTFAVEQGLFPAGTCP